MGTKGVRLLKATQVHDKSINLGQSLVGVGQGVNPIVQNPGRVGGYAQVALGALGMRANRVGGCFVDGTLVMLPPVAPEIALEPQVVYAGLGNNETIGVITMGTLSIVQHRSWKKKQAIALATDSIFSSIGSDDENEDNTAPDPRNVRLSRLSSDN